MEILSLNVNGENLNNVEDMDALIKNHKADVYCFQESKYGIQQYERINTVNYYNNGYKKETEVYKKIWEQKFSWIEYPENYIAENKIPFGNSTFTLINVHLAGFYSGKRYPLMLTLLERLEKKELKNENVILLGDFNAQKVNGNASKLLRDGSKYLERIANNGFVEILKNDEVTPVATYYDTKDNGFRYDHVFVRLKKDSNLKVSIKNYLPESDVSKEQWYSDHRGIIVEIK